MFSFSVCIEKKREKDTIGPKKYIAHNRLLICPDLDILLLTEMACIDGQSYS